MCSLLNLVSLGHALQENFKNSQVLSDCIWSNFCVIASYGRQIVQCKNLNLKRFMNHMLMSDHSYMILCKHTKSELLSNVTVQCSVIVYGVLYVRMRVRNYQRESLVLVLVLFIRSVSLCPIVTTGDEVGSLLHPLEKQESFPWIKKQFRTIWSVWKYFSG